MTFDRLFLSVEIDREHDRVGMPDGVEQFSESSARALAKNIRQGVIDPISHHHYRAATRGPSWPSDNVEHKLQSVPEVGATHRLLNCRDRPLQLPMVVSQWRNYLRHVGETDNCNAINRTRSFDKAF